MFIARQPIFNKKLDVFGYELLFRSGETSNQFDGTSSTGATASVLTGLFESGIDALVENKYALINFDEKLINSDSIELVSPDTLIIEMLESVEVTDFLVKRLASLKKKGYKIALDDFEEDYNTYPLVPLADIIKFDIMVTPLSEIGSSVNTALADKKIILAEKIETQEEYLQAKQMGFHLFQGFFFSRPSIAFESRSKITPKGQYAMLLKELKEDDPSFQKLAEIVETDVNLAYRLIRIASRRAAEEEALYSIKRALVYMGFKEFERWVNILMLQDMGKDKPQELRKTSLIRSKLAENISWHMGLRNMRHEASLMGLFSVVDAMLDTTMEVALQDMALPATITDALVHKKGTLFPLYELIIAYEQADIQKVQGIVNRFKLDTGKLYHEYVNSIKWAKEIFTVIE